MKQTKNNKKNKFAIPALFDPKQPTNFEQMYKLLYKNVINKKVNGHI